MQQKATPVETPPLGKSTQELQDYRLLQLEKDLGRRFDEVMDGLNDLKKDTQSIEKRFERGYNELDIRISKLEHFENERQEAMKKKEEDKRETKNYIAHILIGSIITQAFTWIVLGLGILHNVFIGLGG